MYIYIVHYTSVFNADNPTVQPRLILVFFSQGYNTLLYCHGNITANVRDKYVSINQFFTGWATMWGPRVVFVGL